MPLAVSRRKSQSPIVSDKQPFIEHLMELRDALLRSVVGVLVVFLALFYFANDIYLFISEPLRVFLPEDSSMIATDVASPFFTPFKLTFYLSIMLAMPWVLFQVWRFVAPGMYTHEKRIAIPLLMMSILLFYSGMVFAYFVVFPLVFGFFIGVAPQGIAVMTDIQSYLDFVIKLFFAFGFAFEIPIAIFLLSWIGVVSPDSWAQKRPYVVVGCFVVGMLLTPPDIISQTLLALPMWLLFELGLVCARIFTKNRQSKDDELDDEAEQPE